MSGTFIGQVWLVVYFLEVRLFATIIRESLVVESAYGTFNYEISFYWIMEIEDLYFEPPPTSRLAELSSALHALLYYKEKAECSASKPTVQHFANFNLLPF